MYKVSKACQRDGSLETEVVPLGQIVWSCHLIPELENDLGAVIPNRSVLDRFNSFLVNDFLDMHSYLLL